MEETVKRVFNDFWGFEVSKDQLTAVLAVLEGNDVFVGMATGKGKSLCFQCVPLCLTEPKLVVAVSPLRALRSTFQLVLVTDGCKSFVLFNYDQIQFLQSGSSGGNGTNGTGPNPAQVGINGGDGTHYTIHPYSRTTNLYNLPTWTDPAVSGPAGRWYRRTDQALIGNTPALVCPSSYSQRRGEKCLKMFKKPTKSYTGAKATCASEGAELFIIRSHADTEWVVGMLADFNR
uniref:NIDO domain-containing protein n=1 Tax=Branchiostoma floridae TaxID=7739 RepID=C3ZX05_BRAFL|eukprot:XP_002586909.1 hypothetical protein BRAFLDRAFT_105130 [Branchiostoma floridae]